jgi:ubiquinone/menaquinone biosynthesis C-methylase UbiE
MVGDVSDGFDAARVRSAYDAVAERYEAAFGDELDALPVDAGLVDRIGVLASGRLILEAGAGVGPVARRMGAAQVVACDLSAHMLAFAPPAAARAQADVVALPFRSGSFAAAVARYVLQHVRRDLLPLALGELRRVLVDDGHLLVAVHLGDGHVEFDELLHQRFEPICGAFHSRVELGELLTVAGFTVVDESERGPVTGEADTRRLYVLARATR